MRSRIITPPATEPLSLSDAKAYLRVTHTAEDSLITSQIKSARQYCERACRRAFVTQTIEAVFNIPKISSDSYYISSQVVDPDNIYRGIRIPRGPVASITGITAYTIPDAATVIPTNAWKLNLDSGYIEWVNDVLSPYFVENNFVKIVYVAGTDVNTFAAAYPDIMEAIRITLASMYDQRGYSQQGVPAAAMQLISPYWTSQTYG